MKFKGEVKHLGELANPYLGMNYVCKIQGVGGKEAHILEAAFGSSIQEAINACFHKFNEKLNQK